MYAHDAGPLHVQLITYYLTYNVLFLNSTKMNWLLGECLDVLKQIAHLVGKLVVHFPCLHTGMEVESLPVAATVCCLVM